MFSETVSGKTDRSRSSQREPSGGSHWGKNVNAVARKGIQFVEQCKYKV
jgi:hypothetical protein